ncbi:uncharacterized protein I303_105939 [Kwoniella dejecticola CBS 10117]|uniref:FIST domain-containing protein n=1 Tax=Kwoniella dejecticola CBS 10117 TaxID=1296121 RepID=A0A1A6A0U1_9TREE|nr:uncharacterized protein I303_05962 [Kwoniella dejecticola CBS 10117]OBR83682.1 hypothetical protein I303_05962 [Kwoniella dejecticola CBS 10117]
MPLRRSATTAKRLLHTRAQTFFSPTPEHVESNLAQHPTPNSTWLFLLSTSLENLPRHLPILQKHLPNSIGSFSVTPPGQEPTISVATFPEDVRIFRSALTGRPPAEVGRFQRPESQRVQREEDLKGAGQGQAEALLAGEGWAGMWKGEAITERIGELEGVEAESFLLLTDGRPNPVLKALDLMYPSASKVGLLTAATPFITNRPYTLLHNGQIYSEGTLGLAFKKRPAVEVDFGLVPMTEPAIITGAQGNMLLSIDGANSNPTQVLIQAIQKRGGTGITKEEDFYLGILQSGKLQKAVKILSGDPSRGAMSLDMEDSLVTGQTVQFMHRESRISIPKASPGVLTFSSLPRSDEAGDAIHGLPRVEDGFLALSEGGFVCSNPTASICTAPGATIRVSW